MLYKSKSDRERRAILIRVPETLHQTINRIANDSGETVSSICRAMLREGVQLRAQAPMSAQRSDAS